VAAQAGTTLGTVRVREFDGGWNVRDAPGELAPNESPDLWNVTLDERGGITKRLGQAKYNSTVYDAANLAKAGFNWISGGKKIIQVGAKLYLDTSNTVRQTFSTSARVGFADFGGKLWVIHPIDGLYSSTDGATYSSVAGSPKGTALTAWQNRLLALGDPAQPQRLYASGIGDGTDWLTTAGHGWTNDLRETQDGAALLGFAASPGMDIIGRAGLIVAKQNSIYRVYDSNTGAYQTLDPNIGFASPLAGVTMNGRTIFLSTQGIFWTDEAKTGGLLTPASQKLTPLFTNSQLAYSQAALWCAGTVGDRVKFSLCRNGATANNIALEYHPEQKWIVPGSNACSFYMTDTNGILYGGSPTVNGQVYQQDTTGADDATAISSWFQTRWFEPNSGFLASLWQMRLNGRGSGSSYVRKDYDLAGGDRFNFALTGDTPTYDSGLLYDSGELYDRLSSQETETFYNLGTCRAFSIRVEETSSLTTTGIQIADAGSEPTVGAWSLYGIDVLHVPLGIA